MGVERANGWRTRLVDHKTESEVNWACQAQEKLVHDTIDVLVGMVLFFPRQQSQEGLDKMMLHQTLPDADDTSVQGEVKSLKNFIRDAHGDWNPTKFKELILLHFEQAHELDEVRVQKGSFLFKTSKQEASPSCCASA